MKNPFFSKTILGIVGMVVAVGLNKFTGIAVDGGTIVNMLDEALFSASAILAVYGRAKAEGKIGFKK